MVLGIRIHIPVHPFPQKWSWVSDATSWSIFFLVSYFHKNGLGYSALLSQSNIASIASITWVFLNYHPFLENYVWWVPISFIRFHKNDLECSISWSIRLHKNDPGYSINWLLVHPFPQNLSWVFHFLTSGLSVSTKTVLGIPSTDSLSIHFNENGLGYLAISWLLVHPFPQKRSWIFGHV